MLPITSTIPRGVRSLIIQVTDVEMQCQETKFGPQVYPDEAEEPKNKPKYGDQINFIKTACNVLSSQEKQRGLDICNVEIVEQLVEKKENHDENTTDPVQQEPVSVRYEESEPSKVLSHQSSNYLSDILNLGLCANCNENYLNCTCPDNMLCKKCYVRKSACNCIKKCDVCKGFILTNDININDSLKCFCETNFIQALKTKLDKQHNMGDIKSEDCILEEEQTDVSGDIEQKLDRFNIAPPDPGQTVDLSHVNNDIKKTNREIVRQLRDIIRKSPL